MIGETLELVAHVGILAFVVTSMLSVGMSVTVAQVTTPLRNGLGRLVGDGGRGCGPLGAYGLGLVTGLRGRGVAGLVVAHGPSVRRPPVRHLWTSPEPAQTCPDLPRPAQNLPGLRCREPADGSVPDVDAATMGCTRQGEPTCRST